MKIVVRQNKDVPPYWELINDNLLFVSPAFEHGDDCIEALEKFTTLIKTPVLLNLMENALMKILPLKIRLL
ncbi:hypothetical protein ABWE26_000709 [Escherichia coli]